MIYFLLLSIIFSSLCLNAQNLQETQPPPSSKAIKEKEKASSKNFNLLNSKELDSFGLFNKKIDLTNPVTESFNLFKATDVRFIVSYSFADSAAYSGEISFESLPLDFTQTDSLSSILGIGLEAIIFKTSQSISIGAGSLFEFQRFIKSRRITVLGVSIDSTSFDRGLPPRIAIFSPFINLYYSLTPKLSLTGGGGASFPVVADTVLNFRASVLYQFGASLHLNPKVSLDILYKTQTFKIRDSGKVETVDGVIDAFLQSTGVIKGLAIQLRLRI